MEEERLIRNASRHTSLERLHATTKNERKACHLFGERGLYVDECATDEEIIAVDLRTRLLAAIMVSKS
eukprot:IDg16374t1